MSFFDESRTTTDAYDSSSEGSESGVNTSILVQLQVLALAVGAAAQSLAEAHSRIREIVQTQSDDEEVIANIIRATSEAHDNLREQIDQINWVDIARDRRIQNLHIRVEQQEQEIGSLVDENNNLQNQIAVLNNQLVALQAQLSASQYQLALTVARTSRLEHDMFLVQRAILNRSTSRGRTSRTSSERQHQQTDMENIRNSVSTLHAPLENLANAVQSLQTNDGEHGARKESKLDAESTTAPPENHRHETDIERQNTSIIAGDSLEEAANRITPMQAVFFIIIIVIIARYI